MAEAGEQEALADLALTNRLWSIIATPLLWSAPSVVGNRSAYRFMETVKAWTEESISLGSPGRPVIKEVSVGGSEREYTLSGLVLAAVVRRGGAV